MTLLEVQSLIGLLNFACNVVHPGRTFLRRLTDLTIGLSKPYHHTKLNLEARADLKDWQIFLDNFSGKALFVFNITHTLSFLHFVTDANNAGFGCVYKTKWIFGKPLYGSIFTLLCVNFYLLFLLWKFGDLFLKTAQ